MKVAVIGAGVAGLSTAARLSSQNISVDLYETNQQVGGKMYEYTNENGLRWDTGPTLISLPDEIQRTFTEIGYPSPDLLPLQDTCSLHFSDNSTLKLPTGRENIINYFYQKDNNLGKNIESTLEISKKLYEFAEKELFYNAPPNLLQLGLKALKSKFLLFNSKLTLNSYENAVKALIQDTNLREFFYHFASYVGTIPRYAQAGILSIAHIELGSPIVFPKGGVYSVAEALKNACEKNNVNLYLKHRVIDASLNKNSKKWTVTFEYNNRITHKEYDKVVSNCDPYVATASWLKDARIQKLFQSRLKRQTYRPSESQFVILYDWHNPTKLSHHTKIFPKSWKKSFEEVWLNYKIPEDPCIYLVWPHATDPSISKRVLFISAMAPNTCAPYKWDSKLCAEYTEKILQICRTRLELDFKGIAFKTITPSELEKRPNGLYGGIYSAAYNGFNPTNFNLSGKTYLPNFYFVGAGVHPGAGVTMVMKSARRISDTILNS